jgi:hypothetical protein
MGRSTLSGTVTIRQAYTRQGHSYMVVGIPSSIAQYLDWKPGMTLMYYPTKHYGMSLREASDMFHAAELDDYDAAAPTRVRDLSGPRPNSIAARAKEVEDNLDEIGKRVIEADRRQKRQLEEAEEEVNALLSNYPSRGRRRQQEGLDPESETRSGTRSESRSKPKPRPPASRPSRRR